MFAAFTHLKRKKHSKIQMCIFLFRDIKVLKALKVKLEQPVPR